jgi:hypothetical protein
MTVPAFLVHLCYSQERPDRVSKERWKAMLRWDKARRQHGEPYTYPDQPVDEVLTAGDW